MALIDAARMQLESAEQLLGINRIAAPEKGEGKSRMVGDVVFEECARISGAITPIPGGVGLDDHRHAHGQFSHCRLSQDRQDTAEVLIGSNEPP